ncbi:putative effector protein [Blumeria hordei DH14]|uniref:Putative effector protein n=1 Tax=Blumeria graminis f. sp. hordei (strain DH14) TaxID=546991 RepID=N1JH09_BLUG1|nr:putative effector protein [Blumeria hordei DH14]
MKNYHYMLSGQSLRLKVVFLMLLISVNASFIQRRMEQPKEPGYYCRNRRYSFSEVEDTRVLACNAFTSTRSDARRPRVYIHANDVENLTFEWSLRSARRKYKNGGKVNNTEWIIFNNSCELKDVFHFNHISKKYESCEKIPEIFTSMTSGRKQIPEKPLLQCGSLSWEIEEIQLSAMRRLFKSQLNFIEMKDTSNQIDGPWKKAILGKMMTRQNRRKLLQSIIIKSTYGILQLTIQKSTVFPYFIKDKINRSTLSVMWRKQTIDLTCNFDTKFLLTPEFEGPHVMNSHKLKTLA